MSPNVVSIINGFSDPVGILDIGFALLNISIICCYTFPSRADSPTGNSLLNPIIFTSIGFSLLSQNNNL